MNRVIVVTGYPLSVFNNVIVPYLVNQQPSPVTGRTQEVVWLQNGNHIRWYPYGDSARGVKAWKIYCNVNCRQGFVEGVVQWVLRPENAGIVWCDNGFHPCAPPQWYRRN